MNNLSKFYLTMFIAFNTVVAITALIPAFAEEYFYYEDIEEYGLVEAEKPMICAFDFEDEVLPSINNQAISIAEKSVQNWQEAFNNHATNPGKWELQFVVVPIVQSTWEIWEDECTIILEFLPEVDKPLWDELGMDGDYETLAITNNLGPISDIYIIYLEPEFNEEGLIAGYLDQVAYDLEETIDHEIGHAWSLDHPKGFTIDDFEKVDEGMFGIFYNSFSTMVTPVDITDDIIPLEIPVEFEITAYDIRAMENLYGLDGFYDDPPLTPFQKHLKDLVEKYPEWYPPNHLMLLKELGFLV